ncbi:major facilitator superfamily domain-containing protein [Stachybotrys elegans]|uniref:Major facilitator superfamily domain-containing protein n=1 Tax=Stachybotrys elegans TaxID=80388 RepID=A0A8K0SMA5_9HYPO|nr:major facilitator superfamily domain-containing protein [Stachybotrys elegans]
MTASTSPEQGKGAPAALEADGSIDTKTPTAEETNENKEFISGVKLALVIGSVTIVVFLLLLDQSIISTAVPQITSDLGSLSDVGWYAGAYQLASASLQPLTGKIYTYFRANWVFLIFLFVFEIGSLICGVANTSPTLIGGRAMAGLGCSGLVNGGMTIIAGSVPLEKRPFYTGVMIGIGQMGLIMGPLIGGALTEYATWRWCFYINLPIGGLAAFFLVIIHIPDVTVKEPFSMALVRKALPQLDLVGFAIFAPAAVMFLLALQLASGNQFAWNSSVTIGLLCGSGVTAVLFCYWEWRLGDKAMIPGSLVSRRVVWASCGQIFCMMFCVFVANFYLPIYFQAVRGNGPTLSSVYLLPGILSQLLFVILSGVAVSKLGYYLPWAVGGAAVTAIGCGLASTFRPDTSTGIWVGYQIIIGAGRGAAMQMSIVATQNALPADQIPVSISILIFCQNFGGAISIVVATTIFTQSLRSNLPILAPSVDPQAALAAGGGADAVRALLPADSPEAYGVRLAFSNAINEVFYLLAGFAVATLIFSCGMGWKDVRKKTPKDVKDSERVQDPKDSGEAKENEQKREKAVAEV